MELGLVKKLLEKDNSGCSKIIESLPDKFVEPLVMAGLTVDRIEPGRVLCSMKVPPRLLNTENFLHGGATTTLVDLVGSAVPYSIGAPTDRVSVEISVSHFDAAYLDMGRADSAFCKSLADSCTKNAISDRQREMDLASVKELLEKDNSGGSKIIESLPDGFCEPLVMGGLTVDLIEPSRVLCSMKVPPHLLAKLVGLVGSAVPYSIGTPTDRVSVEVSISDFNAAYLDEEIEIEGKALLVGKAVAVISVELRKKKTGKIIAQGRHTKFIALSSKI